MNKRYIILSVIMIFIASIISCDDNIDEIITEEIIKSENETGSSGNNNEISGTWKLLKNTGISLKNAASAEYNGWLYIHGGENSLGTVNTFWRIDLTSGNIESLGEDIYVSNHDMAVIDGLLYLFGGKDENGDAVNCFRTYDLNNIGFPGWIVEITVSGTNGPFPTARYGHRTVANEGYLYIFGGTDDLGIMDNALYRFDPLDTPKPRWEKINTEGPLVTGAGAAVGNNHIYVFAGFDSIGPSGNNYTNNLWVYDISSNEWAFVTVPGNITPRGWIHCTMINDRLISLWGEHINGVINNSVSYNPAETWSVIINGPDARSNYTLRSWSGYAVIYGGNNSYTSRYFDDIWLLELN